MENPKKNRKIESGQKIKPAAHIFEKLKKSKKTRLFFSHAQNTRDMFRISMVKLHQRSAFFLVS